MTETANPGVAVIGTGFGCLTHVPALGAAGFDVRALVGRDPEKTRTRAARFGLEPFVDVDEALALDGVDAVTIATPPHTHHELVLRAVQAGKHILCEKPFAADRAEAEAMRDAAERAGVVHLLGTEFRWDPSRELMRRLIHDGTIGRPVTATFLLHVPMLADPQAEVPAWWSDASLGGGWLGAHGSHVIDHVRTALGEILAVEGSLQSISPRGWTAEDTYSVRLFTESGAEALIQSSAADLGPFAAMERVAGTGGALWAEGGAVSIADENGTRKMAVPPELEVRPPSPPPADLMHTAYDLLHSTGMDFGPWVRMAETFRALILGEPVAATPPPATFDDGVALMAVMDAIRESSRRRSVVEVQTPG